jgi:multidrug resistance efflux pump
MEINRKLQGQWCSHSPTEQTAWDIARQLERELSQEKAELERERMRLAACGVVALADTSESAAKAREMHADYRSASCDDVARRVDECISLRAELAQARAEREQAIAEVECLWVAIQSHCSAATIKAIESELESK